MYSRKISLNELLKKKSILLLGPRATGKSYYIRNELQNAATINLLRSKEFLRYQSNPETLEEFCLANKNKVIVIDEIQRIPELLNEVHHLIEELGQSFLLTGSSARKLKGKNINLLAGRAWMAKMFPLSYSELGKDFSLEKLLNVGSLPSVYTSSDPKEELDAYVRTYIEAEIKAEGIVRKIPSFSRFLKAAALSSGELLNFQNLSRDCEVPASTIRDHYNILEDTLIGNNLEAWQASTKRKAISTSKFYFFDIGVLNHIADQWPSQKTTEWGKRFEHFIFNEIKSALSYQRKKENIYFWRSKTGFEVDFLFGKIAVEVKASSKIQKKDLRGLEALSEERQFKDYYLVSFDPTQLKKGEITCLHWEKFLQLLWKDKLF